MNIPDKDLKIETVSDRPPGGQSVGVVPKAVRITHVPSGIVAECGTERSQMKNKLVAMEMIDAGLMMLYGEPPPIDPDPLEPEESDL